jgi:hypothetical protein
MTNDNERPRIVWQDVTDELRLRVVSNDKRLNTSYEAPLRKVDILPHKIIAEVYVVVNRLRDLSYQNFTINDQIEFYDHFSQIPLLLRYAKRRGGKEKTESELENLLRLIKKTGGNYIKLYQAGVLSPEHKIAALMTLTKRPKILEEILQSKNLNQLTIELVEQAIQGLDTFMDSPVAFAQNLRQSGFIADFDNELLTQQQALEQQVEDFLVWSDQQQEIYRNSQKLKR